MVWQGRRYGQSKVFRLVVFLKKIKPCACKLFNRTLAVLGSRADATILPAPQNTPLSLRGLSTQGINTDGRALKDREAEIILRTLKDVGGNVRSAAKLFEPVAGHCLRPVTALRHYGTTALRHYGIKPDSLR